MRNRILRLLSFSAAAILVIAAAPVFAQELVMATWGGGMAGFLKEAFVKPFGDTARAVTSIIEVPNPEAQIRAHKGDPNVNAATVTFFQAITLQRDGLIETFDPADFPELKNYPERSVLKSADGRLLGMPVWFVYYGIAVNTDLAKVPDFASWNDLADPKWKDKLAITRPLYSSSYDLVLMAYANGGNERNIEPGIPVFTGFARNATVMYASMAQINQLMQRGEITAVPYFSNTIWRMRRAGQTNMEMIIPREGALMLPFIVVVPKGAKHPEVFKQFLQYVSRPDGQSRLMDLGGYVPLNRSAKLSDQAVKALGQPLSDLMTRLHQVDWDVIASKGDERLNMVEKIMSSVR